MDFIFLSLLKGNAQNIHFASMLTQGPHWGHQQSSREIKYRAQCPFETRQLQFFFLFYVGCATRHAGSQFPDQRSNQRPLQRKRRVLTAGQPGKSQMATTSEVLCLSCVFLSSFFLSDRQFQLLVCRFSPCIWLWHYSYLLPFFHPGLVYCRLINLVSTLIRELPKIKISKLRVRVKGCSQAFFSAIIHIIKIAEYEALDK